MSASLLDPAPAARAGGLLAGRRALVTGSTGGIGGGVARALAEAGAEVALHGTRAAWNGGDLPRPAPYLRADLAEGGGAEAARDLVERAEEALGGPLDILVNNAGVQHVSPLESFPTEAWDRLIALHLTAPFAATRAVFAGMKARGWGRIVNIASAHALVASPFKSAYVAAKHGLLGLTKTTALEGAEAGVTCNAICPGYVRTPLVEGQVAAQARATGVPEERVVREVLLAQQPNRRFAEIPEVAAVVLLLCGPAGAAITGAALPVDGGWTAR